MPFTLNELMVVAAAREIRDGEVVFVGMRLPLIAFVVAKKTLEAEGRERREVHARAHGRRAKGNSRVRYQGILDQLS